MDRIKMRNKQVLIIEDNHHSMERVCNIIADIKDLILFKAVNSEQAYRYALENDIGLFIVDLILDTSVPGDVSGIQFIEQIRAIERYHFTPIIVTTSLIDQNLMLYSHFHCFRYFEKPYSKRALQDAVWEALKYKEIKTERKYYPYKTDGILYHIKIDDIVYVENQNLSTYIKCNDQSVIEIPYRSCKKILLELHSDKFLKCSNRVVVNVEYIDNIDPVNRYIQLMNNIGTLEIGPKIKKKFIEGYTRW